MDKNRKKNEGLANKGSVDTGSVRMVLGGGIPWVFLVHQGSTHRNKAISRIEARASRCARDLRNVSRRRSSDRKGSIASLVKGNASDVIGSLPRSSFRLVFFFPRDENLVEDVRLTCFSAFASERFGTWTRSRYRREGSWTGVGPNVDTRQRSVLVMAPRKKVSKPAGMASSKSEAKKELNPLYERRPKSFGLGQSLPPKGLDLHRFVRWPKYVRLQRQRRVIRQRLKVPPAINQFTKTFDKNAAEQVFRVLMKYRPESKDAKKERLLEEAKLAESGNVPQKKKPLVVKHGINHITYLIEQKKAQLVVIAHDVDPIELVVWLPALCKKMDVPYCIVKGKARLGAVVHNKTATALAITAVKNEDQRELAKIIEAAREMFNDGPRPGWGGGIMGPKSEAKRRAREKVLAKELAQRMAV